MFSKHFDPNNIKHLHISISIWTANVIKRSSLKRVQFRNYVMTLVQKPLFTTTNIQHFTTKHYLLNCGGIFVIKTSR